MAVAAAGGAPLAGAVTAVLLGTRNGLYGLRLAPVLEVRGWRKLVAAHVVSDESVAMALSCASRRGSRLAFWATGASVFSFWNGATVVGALGARMLDDPRVFGLDAAVSGAFLALVAPRLRDRGAPAVVAVAVAASLVTIPMLPVGFPVLAAAAAVFAFTHVRAGGEGA